METTTSCNSGGFDALWPKLEHDLLSANDLLRRIWSEGSRPCLRWVRQRQLMGDLPSVRLGGRVWFDPRRVVEALSRPSASKPFANHRDYYPDRRLDLPCELIDAHQLLQTLWKTKSSRPSLRWLRTRERAGDLPSVRISRKVWFRPLIVWRAISEQERM